MVSPYDGVAPMYLSPAAAAQYVSLTERALAEMRRRGDGPPYIRLGGASGRVRYDLRQLDAWMRERMHTSTSAESMARQGERR